MTTEPNNGNENKTEPYKVIVSMDRETLRVSFDANVKDIDVLMNILQTALRFLDVQYRISAGIKAQEELKQAKEQLDMAQRLMGRA